MTIPIVDDPVDLFNDWLAEAEAGEPKDASAVCLATTTADGRPSARMVLLKRADRAGFVFYTNLDSQKGHELAENPRAALCFHWKSLRRQVRVEGDVLAVDDAEADAYFASRDRQSQIGAWASHQSAPMTTRFELERRAAAKAAEFGFGEVPRPAFWSGFRIVPDRLEFWAHGAFRLHDRMAYERESGDDTPWQSQRLFP